MRRQRATWKISFWFALGAAGGRCSFFYTGSESDQIFTVSTVRMATAVQLLTLASTLKHLSLCPSPRPSRSRRIIDCSKRRIVIGYCRPRRDRDRGSHLLGSSFAIFQMNKTDSVEKETTSRGIKRGRVILEKPPKWYASTRRSR